MANQWTALLLVAFVGGFIGGGMSAMVACDTQPAFAPGLAADLDSDVSALTIVQSGVAIDEFQPILKTVKRCDEDLRHGLAQCTDDNSTLSLKLLSTCLNSRKKEFAACYLTTGRYPGGLSCVMQNLQPFWSDCKLPCYFHYFSPSLETLSDPIAIAAASQFGQNYVECLDTCAEEYFVKRCEAET